MARRADDFLMPLDHPVDLPGMNEYIPQLGGFAILVTVALNSEIKVTVILVILQDCHGAARLATTGRYILRRYWPPTSNSAPVISPSEQWRTALISSAKIFS